LPLASRPPEFEMKIAAGHPTKLLEPLLESGDAGLRLRIVGRENAQQTNPAQLRPRRIDLEQHRRSHATEHDGAATDPPPLEGGPLSSCGHDSITSSARAGSLGGKL